MKNDILSDFDNKKVIYLEYENKIKELIDTLIKDKGINIHGIESRVKDRESLSKKIEKKEGKYNGLHQITDTLGLRIITYFENDVDTIAEIIKGQFELDEVNSVDKRDKEPDSFGYSSLHYVIKLKEPRASLPEYSRFNEINFEIQIRSILQHAWAEIEHDLGYKRQNEIPKDIRRDFSRIAGLLEIADKEFIRIKGFLDEYSKNAELQIKEDKLDILIDKVTLRKFFKESNIISEIDEEIAKRMNAEIDLKNYGFMDDLRRMEFFNITTIHDLNKLLVENKSLIIEFADKWGIRKDSDKIVSISIGISIFYLAYILIGKSQNLDYSKKYVNMFFNSDLRENFAQRIISTYNSIK